MIRLAWLALAVGCAPLAEPPCAVVDEPGLEVSPSDVSFAEYLEGDPLPYGIPPQGGAPYTPLHARVFGLDLAEGATVALWGEDPSDGAALGELDLVHRLVCANVGDSAGAWVASDLHFRFLGWSLDDLAGRSAAITVRITSADGEAVEATVKGPLEPL